MMLFICFSVMLLPVLTNRGKKQRIVKKLKPPHKLNYETASLQR